jgi:prevent-host-death family protein
MTIQMNIAEAKAKLSELVSRAEEGEDVVLARNGKPVATLQALKPRPKFRKLGIWDHLDLDIPDDLFIGPDEETLAAVDAPIFPPHEAAD